jgi:hypothetical protein
MKRVLDMEYLRICIVTIWKAIKISAKKYMEAELGVTLFS